MIILKTRDVWQFLNTGKQEPRQPNGPKHGGDEAAFFKPHAWDHDSDS